MKTSELDPIVAIATPPGRGGIGILRISGKAVFSLMQALFGRPLKARHATFSAFLDSRGEAIDEGIALYFAAPHSYTGEDVLELQGHGGPVVLDLLLRRCLEIGERDGLRIAAPGEFTQRAFLNDRLDLAQAEAVADLIEASTASAARSAQASLSGRFSAAVAGIVEALIELRMLLEARLDFPEEDIDGKDEGAIEARLASIRSAVADILDRTTQGALLRDGLKIVLAGRPNVGKSSLLNALAEAEVAIVTPIAGTTRDKVTQTIQIEGIVLHVVDTAGLRESADTVERIGVERSWDEIARADLILNVRDATDPDSDDDAAIAARLPSDVPRRLVLNKSDLAGELPRVDGGRIYLSALTGEGIELLREEILAVAGWHASSETVFLGRARHLEALHAARGHLDFAAEHALHKERAVELLAEELRLAQGALSSITGEFTSEDLLGEIFSRFCIGK